MRARVRRITEASEPLESIVSRIARRYRITGLSLVLAHPDGHNTYLPLGHARLSPRIPVTEKTCFRVASVSKLVMAFGALSMMEDGLIDLDRDIGDYLGYPVRSPHEPDIPVTMRMLLTHTSGIFDAGNYSTRGMQPGCTLAQLLGDPQNWLPHLPGTHFRYSNLGAGVAGVVMERAANLPFESIMQQRVFAPLSIRASFDPRRICPTDDLADGYSVRGLFPPRLRYDAAALAARPPEPFDPECDYLIAAGRMITDSPGMAALIRLLASETDTPVLRADTLALMRRQQDGTGGVAPLARGLNAAHLDGVFPGYAQLVGHQGTAYGMCAELFAAPGKHCGVALMTSGMRLAQHTPIMDGALCLLAAGFAALGD